METVHLSIRDGEVHDAGSWVYVWVPTDRARVIYVGATGLPPALRAWLHLHHEDPAVARIAARCPAASTEPLEVIACRLPDEVGDPPAPVAASADLRATVTAVVGHLASTLAR